MEVIDSIVIVFECRRKDVRIGETPSVFQFQGVARTSRGQSAVGVLLRYLETLKVEHLVAGAIQPVLTQPAGLPEVVASPETRPSYLRACRPTVVVEQGYSASHLLQVLARHSPLLPFGPATATPPVGLPEVVASAEPRPSSLRACHAVRFSAGMLYPLTRRRRGRLPWLFGRELRRRGRWGLRR